MKLIKTTDGKYLVWGDVTQWPKDGEPCLFVDKDLAFVDEYLSSVKWSPSVYKIVAYFPLVDGLEPLGDLPLLPRIEGVEDRVFYEKFFEAVPVRWVKWTKQQPDWNGSVYIQFNGKNQGNGIVHDKKLVKLDGLATSEIQNYEDTFYWLEQRFDDVEHVEGKGYTLKLKLPTDFTGEEWHTHKMFNGQHRLIGEYKF